MPIDVDISDLEGETKDSLASFVESKLPVKSERSGDTVTFEDKSERTHVSSPKVRTYLKRFMQTQKLKKKYRLLTENGTLKFVKQKIEKEEEEKETD